jgi:hypothetical protein
VRLPAIQLPVTVPPNESLNEIPAPPLRRIALSRMTVSKRQPLAATPAPT